MTERRKAEIVAVVEARHLPRAGVGVVAAEPRPNGFPFRADRPGVPPDAR